MKNRVVLLIILTGIISTIVFFGTTKLGFTESVDPLVTQSYVEMRVEELKTYLLEEFAKSNDSSGDTSNEELEKYIRFIPVELKVGDNLIGGEGSEIVLRSGKAISIASIDGGLLDVTDGTDLNDNENVMLNHMLVIPRSDNRGIRIISASAYAMVKGPYEIK